MSSFFGYAQNSFAIEERIKGSTITNITVEEKAGLTEVKIEVNSPFEHAVYTLSDPYKVVVMLKNVDLGKFTGKIVGGRAGIIEVAPADTGNQHFARLDITLTAPAEVKSSLKGNSLILSVSKLEVKKQEEKQGASKSVNSEVSNIEVKEEKLSEVKATETLRVPTITHINVEEKAGLTEIQIESDSPFTYAINRPSDRQKVVIELDNVDLGKFAEKIVVKRGGVVEIVPTAIEDPKRMARFDITLTAPAEVNSSLKENLLVLSVPKTGVIKEEEKPAVIKTSHPVTARMNYDGLEVRVGNMAFYKNVKTLKDLRFKNIIRQTKDYSCGAASLATILTYYFGSETAEEEVIRSIFINGDSETMEKVKKKGLSLLDLKSYGESLGYKGAGYKVPAHQLKTLDRPAIVLINYNGYSHFIVLRGVVDEEVFLADPARGNMVMGLNEFLEMWNGILLVFKNPGSEKIESHALSPRPNGVKDKAGILSSQVNLGFIIGPSEFK